MSPFIWNHHNGPADPFISLSFQFIFPLYFDGPFYFRVQLNSIRLRNKSKIVNLNISLGEMNSRCKLNEKQSKYFFLKVSSQFIVVIFIVSIDYMWTVQWNFTKFISVRKLCRIWRKKMKSYNIHSWTIKRMEMNDNESD